MSENFTKLYTIGSQSDSAFFLDQGKVFFYATDYDKYAINGTKLILGASELILNIFDNKETYRVDTAIAAAGSQIKKISKEKFKNGMENYSFVLNVSMVLAKQVFLTNRIINNSLNDIHGDEIKNKEISIEFYGLYERIKEEYNKRKLPWIIDVLKPYETSLILKRGEAYSKSEEPAKINTSKSLSDKQAEYERGSIICEEGSDGNEMYILESGVIDIFVNNVKVVTISDPGTVIGEMALLLGEKRTATLKAKNNVVITKLAKSDLKEVAARQMDLLQGVALSLSKKYYYNIMKIESLNKSLIEVNLQDEEEKKVPQSMKSQIELSKLKRDIGDMIHKKKVDFLDDLNL